MTNSDSYYVVVNNSYGSVPSSPAFLSVATASSGTPVPAGVVAWWPGQSNATDVVGGNNGTFSGGYVNGEVAKAFNVINSSSVVRVPATTALNVGAGNGLTIEGWINPYDYTAEPVFEWAPTNSYGVHVWINFQGNGTVWVNIADIYGVNHTFQTGAIITNNGLQHLAVTYDKASGNSVVYVNGVQKTTSNVGSLFPQTGADFWLGCRPGTVNNGSTYNFNGIIDEASVYNRALSGGEVQSIYNASATGKYLPPAITSQPQGVSTSLGGSATFSVTASGVTPYSYQWLFNGAAISSGTSSSYTVSNVQAGNVGAYSVVVASPGGSALSSPALLSVNSCTNPPSGLISWWRAENNTTDQIGTNNGVWNGTGAYASGEVGNAFNITGSNYVQIADSPSLNLTNAFSIEFWYYQPTTTPSGVWQGIVAKRSSDPCNYGVNINRGNALQVYFKEAGGSYYQICTVPTDKVPCGTPHHVIGTFQQFDATHVGITAYIDGGFGWVATNYVPGNLANALTSAPVLIGASTSGAELFTGWIDEVTLYSRALSWNEAQQLYYAGASGKCCFAPVIVSQPQNQTVVQGNNATFSVSASGTPSLGYQWRFKGNNISGATASSYTVSSAQPGNAGLYSVVVSNFAGTATSASALLTVLQPPTITTQPTNQIVPPSGTVTFTVAATGTAPLTYQWYYSGQPIAGANASNYTISKAGTGNAGTYYVVVANSAGSATSSTATLTIAGCANVTSGLISWWRAEGDARDYVGGNDGRLTSGAGYAAGEVGQGFNLSYPQYVRVENSPSLNLTNAFTIEFWYNDMGNNWYFVALAGKCSPLTANFNIQLQASNYIYASFSNPTDGSPFVAAPVMRAGQVHHVACTYQQSGTNVVLQIYIDGVLNGSETRAGSLARSVNDAPFTIGADYLTGGFFTGVMDEVAIYSRVLSAGEIFSIFSAGQYGKCLPANAAPAMAVQPTNQTVSAGSDLFFFGQASNTPPISYQWYFNTTNALAAATNRVYIINNAQSTQVGSYSLRASNAWGMVTSSPATLTVTGAPACVSAPSGLVAWWKAEGNGLDQIGDNTGFLENAAYTNGMVGQGFGFPGFPYPSGVWIPSAPALNLTNEFTIEYWYKDTNAFGGGAYGFVLKYQPFTSCSNSPSANYYIGQAGGDYYLQFNLTDPITGNVGIPYWPVPMQSMFHHVAASYKQQTNLIEIKVYIDGQARLTNYAIVPGTGLPFNGSLANMLNNAPVTIGNAADGSGGFPGIMDEVAIYSRALTNTEISSIFKAGVGGKCVVSNAPAITTQPVSQTVAAGSEAPFTVYASGSPPLAYQWNLNGTLIPGATAKTYVVTDAQIGQAGAYTVLVTNAYGAVMSQSATLTVTSPPSCTVVPSNMISWWRGEGNANDSGPNGNNGTLYGATTFGIGKVSEGFSFDGTEGTCVQVSDSPSLHVTNGFTAELWYKDSGSTYNAALIAKLSAYDPWPGFAVVIVPNMQVAVFFSDPTFGNRWFYYSPVPATGMFHHLAVTYQQQGSTVTANLYIDGQCARLGMVWNGYLTNALSANVPLTIGAVNNFGQWPFTGLIDEPTIYSRALSASEIQAIYLAGASGKCMSGSQGALSVSITSPTNRQYFAQGSNVSISGTNSDCCGQVTQIQLFYRSNSTDVNFATIANPSPTFNYTWSNRPPGVYNISAKALDNQSATKGSPPVVFVVNPNTNPPIVSITYPTNNSIFEAGSDITITASATKGALGGDVTNVDFYLNNVWIGNDSGTPYSLARCCWGKGTYTLTAKATDSYGASGFASNTVTIQVLSAPMGAGFWDPKLTYGLNLYYPEAHSIAADPMGNAYVAGDGFGDGGEDPSLNIGAGNVYSAIAWDGNGWRGLYTNSGYFTNWTWATVFKWATNNILYAGGVLIRDGTNYGAVGKFDGTNWSTVGDLLYRSDDTDDTGISFVDETMSVTAIAVVDSDIYVTGGFTNSVNFSGAQYVAKLTNNTWISVGNGLSMSVTGAVRAITSIAGTLYIGGDFTAAGGNTNAKYLAKLVGNTWTNVGLGVNGPVRALAVCGNKLFVGGDFTTAGGNTNANCVAMWDGKNWTTLGQGVAGGYPNPDPRDAPYASPSVLTLSTHGADLFVGGSFDTVYNAGVPLAALNIAKVSWNEDQQSWTWYSLDGGLGPQVTEVSFVRSSSLYAAPGTNVADLYLAGHFFGSSHVYSRKMAHWVDGANPATNFPTVTVSAPAQLSRYNTTDTVNITYSASAKGGALLEYVNLVIDGVIRDQIYEPGVSSTNRTFPLDLTYWGYGVGMHTVYAVAADTFTPYCRSNTSTPTYFTVVTSGASLALQNDTYILYANSPATFLNVLANDTGSKLKVVKISHLQTGVGNAQIAFDQSGVIYQPNADTYGQDLFTYWATDDVTTNSAGINVVIKEAPVVQITSPATGTKVGTNVSFTLSGGAYDYDGTITNTTVYFNGTNVVLKTTASTFTTSWSTNVAGFYTFVAIATDNDGNASSSPPVTVDVTTGSTNTFAPVAEILSPTNQIVTADTVQTIMPIQVRDGMLSITGRAYSPDAAPVSWQVVLTDPANPSTTLYKITPGNLNSLGFRTDAIQDGVLGTNFDLSMVQNGVYNLTLIVQSEGLETRSKVLVQVSSELKIGQFSFSEQDLVVTVSGVPLSITRTYSSINPLSSDFGYGWTFAINSMDIQLDEQREVVNLASSSDVIDADSTSDGNGLPLITTIRTGGNRDVTLTLPDGRRTTFAFNPWWSSDGFAYARWIAPPNIHATLTNWPYSAYAGVPSGKITLQGVPSPVWSDEDVSSTLPPFDNHDIPGWMLQTADGTQYIISRGSPNMITYDTSGGSSLYANIRVYGPPKLTSIVQSSGDTIHIENSRIYHTDATGNTNRTLWFDRDAQNRITAVHDPMSGSNGAPVLQYIYNQVSGNLLQVLKLTDRVAGTYSTNRYIYGNSAFPHYITEIDNGIGAPITRNFYDSSGRLTSSMDANNNVTQYIHNLTNSLEIVVDPLGHTNTLAYDSRGNVTAVTNALNAIRLASYDSANNKTSEIAYTNGAPYATNTFGYDLNTGLLLASTNALGFTNAFSYNSYGKLTNALDSLGGSSTNYFDANGNLIGVSDDLGNSTTSLYDTNSLLVSVTDPVGMVITNQYDSLGNLVSTRTGYYSNNTFMVLTSTGFAYDSNGNRVAMTNALNALNVVTCFGFDGQNRVIATTNGFGTADQTVTRTIYDAAGRMAQTVDALGVTNAFSYDFAGRQTSVTRALGTPTQQVIQNGYDAVGNRTNVIDNLGRETDFQYDALNRQLVKLFPAATSGATRTGITNAYDGLNRRIATTNSAGVATGFQFDVLSRLITVTNALGKLTKYQWDPLGNQTNQIDALTHSTKFAYDALSRRTQRTMPGGGQTENFTYDSGSRLLRQTNFDGTIITNQYDALGRLVKRFNGATVLETYAYSAMGQLTNRTDASGAYTWIYDALGRLKTNSTPVGTLYYTYDGNGNMLTLSSATATGVSLTYQYDALNRLTNVIDKRLTGLTKTNIAYTFDGVGNLQSLSYPNGITNLWQYDGLNRLTNLTWKLSGAQRGDFAYQLGAAGNRTNLADNVNGTSRTFSWGYDSLYRLTNETVTGGSPTGTLGYIYDDVGNRTSRTGTLGSLTASNNTFDANDTVSGLIFDANGNTRTNGSIYYGYDWANRLTSQTNGAAVVSMVYDADGNRIQRTSGGTTTLYLVATVNPTGYPQVVEEFTVSGGVTNLSMVYSYGLALISQRQGNGTVSFFGSDGLGSTRFLTSTNGTITDTYAYDAFGTVIASTGSTPNSYLFNGQQSDSTLGGLLYLRQRYDIPSLGRLLTRDADEGVPFDPPTLHKYVYAADNPVNRIDPSGNDFVDVMASMYVQAQLATATFFATHGALAETAILVGAISAYNSAQLLSTGIDPDTGEPATVLAAAFGIMDFLPAGEFITKPLGKSAKKLYRAAAVNIWDSLSKVKRTIEDQVHHRIPLEWAHLFPDRNPNRIANLQLIERKIHEGPNGVSAAWTQFRNSLGGRSPTAKEVSDKAAELDARFGSHVKTLE